MTQHTFKTACGVPPPSVISGLSTQRIASVLINRQRDAGNAILATGGYYFRC